jgi:hypothetical protein
MSQRRRGTRVALRELHEQNVLDLGTTVFFGDGRNDVAAARIVKGGGGWIVAVDDKCKELVDEANFVISLATPQIDRSVRGPKAIEWLLTLSAATENDIL